MKKKKEKKFLSKKEKKSLKKKSYIITHLHASLNKFISYTLFK